MILLTLIVVLLCTSILKINEGKLLGAFVLPHGGIALDPNYFHTDSKDAKTQAWALHRAAQTVGAAVRELNPDLIVLSTPHGIADLNQFVFYLNEKGTGPADTDNCACPPCCYNVSVTLDYRTSQDVLQVLKGCGLNVTGLSAYGPPGKDNEPFPLRWGEVIPLHFIDLPSVPVVIMSVPSQRYINSVTMIPSLLKLGEEMWTYIDHMTEGVVLVISGDMCHRFDPNGPFGYSNTSEPFDQAVGQWVITQDSKWLLNEAALYVDKCYSCGYTGFVMLEGVLSTGRRNTSITWDSNLLANYHPSYYGMMVAQYIPSPQTRQEL